MFKCTFLERENIVESRSSIHLSLRGLDVQKMAIKDWWSIYFIKQRAARNLPKEKIDLAMNFRLVINQSEARITFGSFNLFYRNFDRDYLDI